MVHMNSKGGKIYAYSPAIDLMMVWMIFDIIHYHPQLLLWGKDSSPTYKMQWFKLDSIRIIKRFNRRLKT